MFSKLLHKDVTGERLHRYPELLEFADDRRRHKAYKRAVYNVAKRNHFPLLARLVFFGTCIASIAALSALRFPGQAMRTSAALGLCAYILLELYIYRWAIPLVRGELRRMLDDSAANCRQCDYSLVGNTSGRCPECGRPIPDNQQGLIPANSD